MFNWTTLGEVIVGILLLGAIAIATRYAINQIQLSRVFLFISPKRGIRIKLLKNWKPPLYKGFQFLS
ncbi:hypothetical protein BN2127_JRS4_01985 [Bacillus cereus]|nr:hypothetical protein BN2127_JRS4_01985 [Bacillus cereus]